MKFFSLFLSDKCGHGRNDSDGNAVDRLPYDTHDIQTAIKKIVPLSYAQAQELNQGLVTATAHASGYVLFLLPHTP